MKYNKDFLGGLYKMMVRIRTVEESFVQPILDKKIICPVHLCSGEEAVPVGISASLSKKDFVFGTHRSHGHYLAKGGDMGELVAEIYGKETGCSRGRGGSMHLIDPENGMLGAAPIVGGTISLALGAALASQIRKNKQVSISYFGDGATGEGALSESMNFASLKKLPIIFVCENNLYSTHMHISKMRDNTNNIADLAKPHNIKSYTVDGNDVLKVYETSKEAIEYCREGNGPVFMEFLTYRQRGHVGPDDNIQGTHTDIRPREEINEWLEKDPILRLKKVLLENNFFNNAEINKIHKEVELEVEKAFIFSDNSNKPQIKDLSKYVYK